MHRQSLVVPQTQFNALVPVQPSQEDPLIQSQIDVNTLQLWEEQVTMMTFVNFVIVIVVVVVHQ